jgi:hypothetical protein
MNRIDAGTASTGPIPHGRGSVPSRSRKEAISRADSHGQSATCDQWRAAARSGAWESGVEPGCAMAQRATLRCEWANS